MKFRYETDRLIMQVLSTNQADDVLAFMLKNRDILEPVEPKRDEDFYTTEYMRKLLIAEQQLFMRLDQARYYLYLKDDPSSIIGCVHFYDIKRAAQQSCVLGYKIDKDHHHKGIATEAIQKGMELMFGECGLHRIEAHVMPQNEPSIELLEKLGFEREGVMKQKFMINGRWEDHILYAKLRED